jgi:murein L,D-transpeptidase YcbB/YkuD
MPVYITYITAWVGPQGNAHFSRDIYNAVIKNSEPKEKGFSEHKIYGDVVF